MHALLDFFPVDGTMPFVKGMPRLQHGNAKRGVFFNQLISRKDSAGSGADNDDIVFHLFLLNSYWHFVVHKVNGFFEHGLAPRWLEIADAAIDTLVHPERYFTS